MLAQKHTQKNYTGYLKCSAMNLIIHSISHKPEGFKATLG